MGQLLEETGDIEHEFWKYFSTQVHRLEKEAKEKAEASTCPARRMRYREIANTCNEWTDPRKNMRDDLIACAKSCYTERLCNLEDGHDGKLHCIATIRLCLLICGLTAAELEIPEDAIVLPSEMAAA